MVKWLLKVLEKFVGSKFAKFLLEVFADKTGEIIEDSYEFVNEYVKNVENIGEYIEDNPDKSSSDVIQYVKETYGYELELDDVELIDENKGYGKYKLVYRLVIERMEEEGKNIFKEGIEQGLNLAIEFAVNRFFGKK